jgi:heptaprenyl diphosphate synthase
VYKRQERLVPIQAIVPINGLKLGLANIVTMFALFFLGARPTFAIVIVRCLLGMALGMSPISFAFSITGALFAAITMLLLKKGYDKQLSLYGISLAGSAAFNIGQVLVASLIMQDIAIFTYVPVLMVGGCITGLITASISTLLFDRIKSLGLVPSFLAKK